MFVQFIHGHVDDPESFRRTFEEWDQSVKPGATGFLGSTGGVSTEGEGVVVARFESSAAAQANSERPEQSAWWAVAELAFSGPVTFHDTEDVELLLGGGSDDAGFVQIMRGKNVDRAVVAEMDAAFETHAPTWRPDVLGGLRGWTAPNDYVEVIYFTSAAEARANEQLPPPPELADRMGDFEQMMKDVLFVDIEEPFFLS